MLRTLRNLTVNLLAAFIRDRGARHKFRNKYKRKSKFRKLRDDNRRLFAENKMLFTENKAIMKKLLSLESMIKETRYIDWGWGWPPIIKQLEDLFIIKPQNTSPVYVSIACIAKNEGDYIKEWIEYHKIVGIERFYFYDNESNDNTKEILRPYINDGTVVYHYVVGSVMQMPVYHDAVLRYAYQTYWLALIDLDEFIVPKVKESVVDFLKDYEAYPGVVMSWVRFDSNGYEKKPSAHGGLVTANYTRVKAGYDQWFGNKTIKSIVRPSFVAKFINPHQAIYKGGLAPVAENFKPVFGPYTDCSVNKIQLNHYQCKSREEYIKKIERGRADVRSKKVLIENELNYENTENDYAISKYLPKLKAAMGVIK